MNDLYLHGEIPTWNDFVAHPNYDAFWQRQALAPYLTRVTVPTLIVGGWWDQEDLYGPQKLYETLEPLDRSEVSFFVAGPWNHGGWSGGDGSSLGRIKFGSNTSEHYRKKIEAPFFACYLKDKPGWDVPEAVTFQTGANAWQVYDEWPPRRLTEDRGLYFREDGRLAFEAPAEANEGTFDSYVSDPAHPVPYRPRPIEATYDPQGLGLGALARRGPALRPPAAGRPELGDRAAGRGRHRDRTRNGPPLRRRRRARTATGSSSSSTSIPRTSRTTPGWAATS